MGLDTNGIKFVLYAQKQGVDFSRTAMIGRQHLILDAEALQSSLGKFGVQKTKAEAEQILQREKGFAEPFYELVGAKEISSFDASDYEKATFVHDFNEPLPADFTKQFSVVFDGGTLEHVFNFPTAIKNCMKLVELNGHFLSITPTNNYLGHGFYQFSPELYFRVFSPENGFQMQQMLIYEDFAGARWYEVIDPNALRQRVILINKQPTLLLLIAKKIAEVPVFQQTPQQSDYFAAWQKGETAVATVTKSSFSKRLARLPFSLATRVSRMISKDSAAINRSPQFFKPLEMP